MTDLNRDADRQDEVPLVGDGVTQGIVHGC